jgi:hypothetical protein
MKWFRWWWLLLLIPIIAGLARLHFDVEMLDLLPAQVPAVQGLKIYQEHFTDARELIITVRAPDRETAELAARKFAARDQSRCHCHLAAAVVGASRTNRRVDRLSLAESTAGSIRATGRSTG